MMFARFKLSTWLAMALLAPTLAWAQEATIRKNLSERLPNLPKIDEISKTPMNG
ncbi:MAG: putative thiol:disulfide interchange protein DsbC precursor, partial [Pseudomonadota bacterium]